jgi:hypothetical protein
MRRDDRRPKRADSPRAADASPRLFPGVRELLDPREPFLVPLLALLIARAVAWIALPLSAEDAYITYRYARNLALNGALIYNPGERVMGFSSPLWTVWVALGQLARIPPEAWTRVTTVLAEIVALIVAVPMLRRAAGAGAAWAFALFFALWPSFAAVAVSGMENSLFLPLTLLGAGCAARRHPATGPVLGALALLRPEGVAAAAVLAIGAGWRDRAAALAIAAAGWGALGAYFGSIVPQSVIAKSTLYGTPGPWAGRVWWEWLSPLPLGRLPTIGEGAVLFPMTIVMAPACVLGARVLWAERRQPVARAAAALLAVWAGYALLGVAYFFWYFVVPLAGLALVASAGFPRLVRGRALPVACALAVLGAWVIARPLYLGRAQNEFYAFGQVAEWLRTHAQPGESVMLEPIGMIGYRNGLVVIDEVGLVSPAVAARRLRGPGWYADIAAERRPDWLVVRRGVLRSGTAFAGAGAPFRNAAERDSTLARYALETSADDASGDNALAVLRRVR